MDNLGSEVGQKMRSAVKAKLIELGTGGLAGYIDDELPDYVMIMIANKRSKQQMIGDLQLFLGSQTELFVTWLHEVLQKLQEVTLPAAVVHKTKRKSETTEAPVAGKKEKKEKKKDKDKKVKKSSEQAASKDSNSASAASISDVFADHLLQKAKKTMQNESVMTAKVKKGEALNTRITRDEFDIPTITEISESVEEISRKKDLEELTKIQKKIYQAKAKLKMTEMDESEDEDYLNIRADGEELDVVTDKTESRRSKKNPIVYDSNDKVNESRSTESYEEKRAYELEKFRRRIPITFSGEHGREEENREVQKKKSIHERLGFNTKNSNSNELNFRRLDRESVLSSALRSRSSEKAHETRFSAIEKEDRVEKSRQQSRERSSDESTTMRRRIGSRVIVAPPKKAFEENEDYEDTADKTVSSMIKIKPRPSISPSKQASKNLLLRAVAEAQKSTALVQSKKDSIRDRSPKRLNTRPTKLHTKSLRSRIRESVMKRITKDNIVIEIKSNKTVRNKGDGTDNKSDDEYVPEPVYDRPDSDNDYVYIPQTINFDAVDDVSANYDEDRRYARNKTQFVVTLDDKTRKKYITAPQKSRLLDKCLNGVEKRKPSTKDLRSNLKVSHSSYDEDSCTSPYTYSSPRNLIHHQKVTENKNPKKSEKSTLIHKPKEQIKKIIIKNDSDDDDNFNSSKEEINNASNENNKEIEDGSLTPPLPKQPISNSPSMKRKRSPITFDIDDNKNKKEEIIKQKTEQISKVSADMNNEENTQKISTKKIEATKKYENIPESLSSIAVEAPAKIKAKERCKYFPSCGKGESCEYFHPTTPCKAFPSCKFVEKCLYLHPKCKFDLTCNRVNCNFSHSAPVTTNTAPPLSSHVVPVQNYKSISANALPAICKYYPNCTNSLCTFYHPKLCRFGKNCMNKVECNFYHFDLPVKDKFKWVANN